MWMCAYIYISWVDRCVCNMCDGNSSGRTLHVCVYDVEMLYDASMCLHVYLK